VLVDKQLNIRCCEVELEAWRVVAGREPLAAWVRRVLNGQPAVREELDGV
jgi:hypothetical protein